MSADCPSGRISQRPPGGPAAEFGHCDGSANAASCSPEKQSSPGCPLVNVAIAGFPVGLKVTVCNVVLCETTWPFWTTIVGAPENEVVSVTVIVVGLPSAFVNGMFPMSPLHCGY